MIGIMLTDLILYKISKMQQELIVVGEFVNFNSKNITSYRVGLAHVWARNRMVFERRYGGGKRIRQIQSVLTKEHL